MEVGIREFKARLSHYVRAARAGERVVVTERGRPVAHLTAAFPEAYSDLPSSLTGLIEQGRVTAPSRTGQWAPVVRARAKRSVSEILGEDRGNE
jgi:prevent-host-death family protein